MAKPGEDRRMMKREMTLDLALDGPNRKRIRNQLGLNGTPGTIAPVLTSPDLKNFTLASPEVERFIKNAMHTNSAAQQTPVQTYLLPNKNPTSQQTQFVKGFEEALENCKRRESSSHPSVLVSTSVPEQLIATAASSASVLTGLPPSFTGATTLTTLTSANLGELNKQTGGFGVSCHQSQSTLSSAETHSSDTSDSTSLPPHTFVKDEQTVPGGTSGCDRIDMRDQEKLKLERKRQRNRVAASKCRKKKIERITQLEDQVHKLKGENSEFEKMISMLQQEVSALRQEAHRHQQQGCLIEL